MPYSKTGWKLINEDGQEVKIGDAVTTFRGEAAVVVDWIPPQHDASTGRVAIKFNEDQGPWSGHTHAFFPSVVDCKIVRTGKSDG